MKDLTIKEYVNSTNTIEYDLLLKNLNPKNEFNSVVFNENNVTYIEVKSIIKLLRSGEDWNSLYNVFEIMYNVSEDVFYESSITEFYACRNYIFKYINDLQKRETKLLQSINVDSALWESAGGDRLNKYSDVMPLIQIGEKFSIYPFELENKKYVEILIILASLKDRAEVQAAFDKLKSKVR